MIKWMVNDLVNIGDEFNRIQALVFPEDDVRVLNYTGCGFEIDGVLRKYVYKNNEYRDVWVLSKLLQS